MKYRNPDTGAFITEEEWLALQQQDDFDDWEDFDDFREFDEEEYLG